MQSMAYAVYSLWTLDNFGTADSSDSRLGKLLETEKTVTSSESDATGRQPHMSRFASEDVKCVNLDMFTDVFNPPAPHAKMLATV